MGADQSLSALGSTWVRRDVKQNTHAALERESRRRRRLMVVVGRQSHYYNYRGKKPLMQRKVALPSRFEWIALNEGQSQSERLAYKWSSHQLTAKTSK